MAGSLKKSVWLQRWARLGFATGGVVYVVIGAIAILVALGHRGRTSGPQGAIQRIGSQPFGEVLLGFVAIGLFGYAAWCFVQAILDTDHDGSDMKGVAIRIGGFFSGLGYVSLGLFAFHRMAGEGDQGDATQHWTAKLLQHSWGAWLVAIVGIVLIGVGIGLLFYAAREGFRKYLVLSGPGASNRDWVVRFGKWGYSAQGVVLSLIGAFLITAAVRSNAREAHGLDGALQVLSRQEYGPWLLGIVAAGLTAYGLFMLIEAKYRRLT